MPLLSLISWFIPLASIVIPTYYQDSLTPAERLFFSTLPLLIALKLNIIIKNTHKTIKNYSKIGLLLYLLSWPGMDVRPFESRSSDRSFSKYRIKLGLLNMAVGISILFFLAKDLPNFSFTFSTWAAIAALLITFHFGFSEILTQTMHAAGWRVQPLFNNPLLSISLREFWSSRWNLAFVEMNRLIFLPLFRKVFRKKLAVFSVFALSAALHEYAVSLPAQGGWGGPALYFIFHGALVGIESNFALNSWPIILRRLWTFFWIILPLPILFHHAFRKSLVLPLLEIIREAL